MVISIANYRPSPRYDSNPWVNARIDGTTALDAAWAPIQTYTLDPVDDDPTDPQERSFTMENVDSDVAYLRVAFLDGQDGEEDTDPIPVAPPYTLADVRDVRARVGRDLTDDEATQVQFLARMATITIYTSLSKPSAWTAPSDAFDYLNVVAVEMVARTFANPDDLQSRSESIGNYSYTNRYNRNAPGMVLTGPEELMIRNAVYGVNTASVKLPSQADEYANNIWWPYLLWYGALPDGDSQPFFVWK
jgi:hypothetical protein